MHEAIAIIIGCAVFAMSIPFLVTDFGRCSSCGHEFTKDSFKAIRIGWPAFTVFCRRCWGALEKEEQHDRS